MSSGEQEQTEVLGESDWDDQDLLTIDEASERLVVEIAALRDSLQQEPDGAEHDKSTARLRLMERVLESLEKGPSPLASIEPNPNRSGG
ncbi:hypothetical protein Z045_25185 [Rhodococcus pyridinivorans KG-16]|uniref:Uncharacterized protein n=1 Tax=Rhodococcus pyridinivorans KG-16 TaxID=1441730 RepID=A0A0V9UDN0_9NOCA|nr:hypothetical protein [Rhodococcus pyridinivorans]KSZ56089.1 hypothetical protein Z045_25185 [Rhodococcus pyridinivorans KG-16]